MDDDDSEDLRDAGTDVVDILAGRVVTLRLGHVPAVNRGQCDIDMSKPIQHTLDAERTFLPRQGAILRHTFSCTQA